MDTLPQKEKTKKAIVLFLLLFCFLLPLLNQFGLQLLYARRIDGNVAYRNVAPLIENCIEFFNVVSVFAGYAAISYSVLRFSATETRPYLWIGAAATVLMQFYPFAVAFFTLTPNLFALNAEILLINVFLNLIIFLLLYFSVFVIAAVIRVRIPLRAKKDTLPLSAPLGGRIFSLKHPILRTYLFVSLLYFGVNLAQVIPATVADFSEYGPPVNMNELVYIAEPYVSAVLYFLIGYFFSVGTAYFLDRIREKEA